MHLDGHTQNTPLTGVIRLIPHFSHHCSYDAETTDWIMARWDRYGSGLPPFWRTFTIRGSVSGGRMFIMETMERKQSRWRRRSFTPEFKAEIVERCRAGDRAGRP
jgi:hypothetical protein